MNLLSVNLYLVHHNLREMALSVIVGQPDVSYNTLINNQMQKVIEILI